MITFISAIKDKLSSCRTVPEENSSLNDMGILDHIEKIVEISQEYGIDKCLSRGKPNFDYIAEKLGISPSQAVLFSHFMERSGDSRILISEIAESIKCSKVRIIKYIGECEELEKKKLIRCRRDNNSISFRIPCDVRDSLRKSNEFKPKEKKNLTIFKFFSALKELFEEREENELTYEAMAMELQDLLNMNMHLEFCKKIKSYDCDEDDLVLLLCFCHLYGNNNDDNIRSHDLEFLFEEKDTFDDVISGLIEGYNFLIDSQFVEYANNNGFADSESWKLTNKTKKELLFELKGKKNYQKCLVLFEKIKPKKMYYNKKETGEINKLCSLLQEENFRKIQERLNGKGMRKGFACLFSGGPGTGKTETAWQIARETKRNVMVVDISETKSMWFGESEKKIKEVFDTYRAAVDSSEVAPILLFNEADAVIGKRKEFSAGRSSVDQTENTIQNIILQEMENLSGILIATTNLTQNLDSAFERRFLYKITFGRPAMESREGIWKTLLPDLPGEKAKDLANTFELSGGQIENIARKIEVDGILSGNVLSIDTLAQYCRDEIKNSFYSSTKVGFTNA